MTKLRRLFLAGMMVTLLVPTSGCTLLRQLLSRVKTPQAKILSVKPELTQLNKAILHFTMALHNPNPIGVKLAGMSYDFNIQGRQVARGQTRRGLSLKAQGTSRTQVDVAVNLGAAAQSLIELLQRGAVQYEGSFELVFNTPIGKIPLPLAHRGKLPLPKAPPVIFRGIQIQGIGPSGVAMLCKIRVANPNPFATPIDRLKLGLKINGRSLSQVSAPKLMMQPGQSMDIPLTVHASLQNIGLTVVSLAQRPRLNYEAKVDFGSGPLRLPINKKGKLAW